MYANFFPDEQVLFNAVIKGDLQKVDQLIEKGISITSKAPDGGKQALHIACHAQQKAMVEKLLSLGADVNAMTDRGFTPLHVAAQQGNKEILLMLVKAGADINAVTDKGMGTTPLQEAAHKGHLTAVNVLLVLGADAQYQEKKYHLTATDLARRAGHEDIAIALVGYKKAFINRIKTILDSWRNVFLKNTPQERYYLQLKNISVDIEADTYFQELKIKLDQNYQPIKEDVQKLRKSIIDAMKQYNADKILENEVKQITLIIPKKVFK